MLSYLYIGLFINDQQPTVCIEREVAQDPCSQDDQGPEGNMTNMINRHLQCSGWDEATTGIRAGAMGAHSTEGSVRPKQGWGGREGQRMFSKR